MAAAGVTTYFLTSGKDKSNTVLRSLADHFANLSGLSVEELHARQQLADSAVDDEVAKRRGTTEAPGPQEEGKKMA